MLVWGGDVGSDDTDTGSQYDPATDTWTATSTAGASAGSRMLVWRGLDSSGNLTNTDASYLRLDAFLMH